MIKNLISCYLLVTSAYFIKGAAILKHLCYKKMLTQQNT